MSTTRILLKQNSTIYRLFRLETAGDGSVVILVDRDPDARRGGMTLDPEGLRSDDFRADEISPHGKFTCHVTGQINRWARGARRATHYVEPLTRLTKAVPVGFLSVPSTTRLDAFVPAHHVSDASIEIEIAPEVFGRITFGIELAPKGQRPLGPSVVLGYETYSVFVRPVDYQPPEELKEHFIEGSPARGSFDELQLGIAEAEIEFHQKAHDGALPLFREDSGAYVLLAAVPMRIHPKVLVEFARADLSAEQILPTNSTNTHKVRFWIRDKGGETKRTICVPRSSLCLWTRKCQNQLDRTSNR